MLLSNLFHSHIYKFKCLLRRLYFRHASFHKIYTCLFFNLSINRSHLSRFSQVMLFKYFSHLSDTVVIFICISFGSKSLQYWQQSWRIRWNPFMYNSSVSYAVGFEPPTHILCVCRSSSGAMHGWDAIFPGLLRIIQSQSILHHCFSQNIDHLLTDSIIWPNSWDDGTWTHSLCLRRTLLFPFALHPSDRYEIRTRVTTVKGWCLTTWLTDHVRFHKLYAYI